MATEQQQPVFIIEKIFVKDLSFEAPHAPQIFKKPWKPEVKIDLNTESKTLDDHHYEVVLHITATVKSDEDIAFIAEVKQSGVFLIKDMNEEQLSYLLNASCQNILFPYAREQVASLISRGGFPEFSLAPVNFDAMYLHKQAKQATATGQVQ